MLSLFKLPWIKWLLVLVALLGVGVVLRFVLIWRELPQVARVVEIVTIVLASLWCYYGLHLRRDRLWARTQRTYLILTNAAWLIAFLFYLTGRIEWAINLLGIWSLIAIGLLGVWLIGVIVSAGNPVLGVARTVILQATRLHVVKVVIAAVVLMLMLLPGALDPAERLNYRVGFYLVWSLRMATFMLSIMTAVLACYTICSDLSQRQMFMLASKPVGRFQYLAGKWLGLALLNAVLCAIVGVGVWLGARVLAAEPLPLPLTEEAIRNKAITDNDVLAARVTAYPVPSQETDLQSLVNGEFEELKRQFPGSLPNNLADVDGKTLSDLRGKAIARWHTIEPLRFRTYVFEGFKPLADEFAGWSKRRQDLIGRYEQLMRERREEEAQIVREQIESLQAPGATLRLRIKPKYTTSSPDGMVRLALRVGGQTAPLVPMPNDTVRELPIPISLVGPDGKVVVSIANANTENPDATHQSNIKFEPYEGIEMLYSAGTFEGNLVRSMTVHWLRLGFLAMLSIAAGTFLGFPMACLTSIFVYAIAVFSSFASESLNAYGNFSVRDKSKWEVFVTILNGMWEGVSTGDIGAVLKLFVKLIGDTTLLLVPSFGYYNSTPLLADGRMVTLELVLETGLYVGLIWTGVCMLGGWLLFRNKELARVTV